MAIHVNMPRDITDAELSRHPHRGPVGNFGLHHLISIIYHDVQDAALTAT